MFIAIAISSPYKAYYLSMALYTIFSATLLPLISHRSTFLVFTQGSHKIEQVKIAFAFAIMICIEWNCLPILGLDCILASDKPYKFFVELLFFEHIMFLLRYTLEFLKYTLLLWCSIADVDYKLAFPWFSTVRHSLVILSFAVKNK